MGLPCIQGYTCKVSREKVFSGLARERTNKASRRTVDI